MPKTYRTVAGDVWDMIAHKALGSTRHTERLINANRDKIETFIFKAGVELTLPQIETTQVTRLPPWRR